MAMRNILRNVLLFCTVFKYSVGIIKIHGPRLPGQHFWRKKRLIKKSRESEKLILPKQL